MWTFHTLIAFLALGPCADPPQPKTDPAVEKRVKELIDQLAEPAASSEKLEDTRKAIVELATIGPPAVPLLVDAIVRRFPDIEFSYACLALERIGKRAVPDVMAEWSKLADDEERWRLMRFRGKYDYENALPFVLAALDSHSSSVMTSAANYLGQYKEIKARKPLIKKLNTTPAEVRWVIVTALTRIGGEEVIDALIKLLDKDSWAAKGIGQPKLNSIPPPWWPDGRPHIVAALGEMKAKKAALPLVVVLQEKGAGRAYLGSRIIPVLKDLGVRECTPELRRIVEANPLALVADIYEPKYIQEMALEAVRVLENNN